MKKKILFAIQLICSLGLMIWIFRSTDWKVLSNLLSIRGNHIYFLIFALILHFFGLFILTIRWRMFLSGDEQKLFSLWEMYKVLMISRFFTNLLPGQFSSDSYRAYVMYNRTKKLGNSMMTVLFDRVSGMFVIFVIAIVAVIFNFNDIPAKISYPVMIIFSCLLFLIFLLIINTKLRIVERFFYKNKFMKKKVYNLVLFLRNIISEKSKINKILLTSLVFQTILIITAYLTFLIYDPSVNLLKVIVVYPLISTFMIIPISISGLGQREAIYIYLYTLFGISKEVALSASLTQFAYHIIASLTGGIFYLNKKYNDLRTFNR